MRISTFYNILTESGQAECWRGVRTCVPPQWMCLLPMSEFEHNNWPILWLTYRNISSIFIVGDLNADLSDQRSMFANHLKYFFSRKCPFLSIEILLPKDSYTYISEGLHNTSWLGHWICTSDAHNTIKSMRINWVFQLWPCAPFFINMGNLPSLTDGNYDMPEVKISWSTLTEEDIRTYFTQCETRLSNIELPFAVTCYNINCQNAQHRV